MLIRLLDVNHLHHNQIYIVFAKNQQWMKSLKRQMAQQKQKSTQKL